MGAMSQMLMSMGGTKLLTLTTQNNVDLRVWSLANGWNGIDPLKVTIPSGNTIGATTGNAITISGSFPAGIELRNEGTVTGATGATGTHGAAGGGGYGGYNYPPGGGGAGGAAGNGGAGGSALYVTTACKVVNTGTLAMGAGGAAGTRSGGGGGGGGAGYIAAKFGDVYSAGGSGGNGYSVSGGGPFGGNSGVIGGGVDGGPGGAGGASGASGAGGGSGTPAWFYSGGAAGGAAGAAGSAGANGYYINGVALVTLTNTGTLTGTAI